MTLPNHIALVLAALGGCTAGSGAPSTASTAGFACSLEERGGTYTARLVASEPLSGRYALTLAGDGVDLGQSGTFEAAGGATLILGEASLGRRLPQASLEVEAGGRHFGCPLVSR